MKMEGPPLAKPITTTILAGVGVTVNISNFFTYKTYLLNFDSIYFSDLCYSAAVICTLLRLFVPMLRWFVLQILCMFTRQSLYIGRLCYVTFMAPVFCIYHTKQCSFLTRSAGQNKPFNFFRIAYLSLYFSKWQRRLTVKLKRKKLRENLWKWKWMQGNVFT